MAMPFDIPVVCPVFIGRTEALASFERVFEQAVHTVLQGTCFELDRVLPFAPLLDGLRTLLVSPTRDATLRRLSPLAPELIKLLPELALWLPGILPSATPLHSRPSTRGSWPTSVRRSI